jgi:hypothetical protein
MDDIEYVTVEVGFDDTVTIEVRVGSEVSIGIVWDSDTGSSFVHFIFFGIVASDSSDRLFDADTGSDAELCGV